MISRIRSLGISDQLAVSGILGIVLTAASYMGAAAAGYATSFSMLEAVTVALSYSCTYLATIESRYNYPVGVLGTLLYSILFYKTGLYAVALFNLYLVFSLIYGWFRWGPDGERSRAVTDFGYATRWPLIYLAVGLGVYLLLALINNKMGASMTRLDIGVAVLSGIAQVMLDNKHRQTWIVWAGVNVFSIWLYFQGGLYLVTIQYMFFLANTILGYGLWTQSMRKGVSWQTA